jgi:hypothetical protein
VCSQRASIFCQSAIAIGVALATVGGAGSSVLAQSLKDVQTSDTPLVLKAQGSFFVGGEKVEQTQGELGDLGPGGHITVNQMYVRYMVPQGGDGNPPVVMVHGATLTGKSWETTPDGRMGWDEYFVRRGHPVYGSLKAAGGQAQMISPTEIGTRGNSHMIMQDKNYLQVADLILKWIDERVSKRAV